MEFLVLVPIIIWWAMRWSVISRLHREARGRDIEHDAPFDAPRPNETIDAYYNRLDSLAEKER